MSLILIQEDGGGRADANSYASAADGDAYHAGHLYASAWTAAATAQKEAALVMATRLIDAACQFNGWKRSSAQALQWPRAGALDPDQGSARRSVLENAPGGCFPSDRVPAVLVAATCEQARELLAADRTADPAGEGIRQLSLVGSLSVIFDPQDRPPMLAHLVQAMLAKLGSVLSSKTGTTKLIRT